MLPVLSPKKKLEKAVVETVDPSSVQLLLGLAVRKKRRLRIKYVFVQVHIRPLSFSGIPPPPAFCVVSIIAI